MEIFDHTFSTQKQLWRVHAKLNKNKIKSEVPGDAESVAEKIEQLQFSNGQNKLTNLPLLDNTILPPSKKFSFGEVEYCVGDTDVAICEKCIHQNLSLQAFRDSIGGRFKIFRSPC